MPVVGISLPYLRRFLKEDIGVDRLIETFHEMGCSVDGIETTFRRICKSCGETLEYAESAPVGCDRCGKPHTAEGVDFEQTEPVESIRLELLANRPDNFDAPGIARSLNGYLGKSTGMIDYQAHPSEYEVAVDPTVSAKTSYRPVIACAIIRDVSFDEDSIKSLMKLQENLHWALGRNRKFGAIGVYDLSTIGKKIRYLAATDEEIRFVPLNIMGQAAPASPREILASHPKGKDFAHLLNGFERFPLLIDEKGLVLSMPPIINSEATRVDKNTTGLFIDVTGLNAHIPETMLNIIVTSIKEACPSCSVYSVTVKYPDRETATPKLAPSPFRMNFDHCRGLLGHPLTNGEIIDCLKRMRYDARENGDHAQALVPCYRSDIKHEQDLMEDVAIAFGFKNFPRKKIRDFTIGRILPAEAKKQEIRETLVGMGFLEIVSIMLTSEQREFEKLMMPVLNRPVAIDNPISADQTIVRTGLVGGIIEIIAANTSSALPQRIFETGEVAYINETTGDPGEEVFAGIGVVDSKIGFSDIKSVLKNLMREMGFSWNLSPNDFGLYLPGRSANVLVNDAVIGHLGEVHPKVLDGFGIPNPVVVMELSLSKMGFIA